MDWEALVGAAALICVLGVGSAIVASTVTVL